MDDVVVHIVVDEAVDESVAAEAGLSQRSVVVVHAPP